VSFAEAGNKVIEGAAAGLYQAGTVLMATSQQLVPVDTGTLKRSGHVEEPVYMGDHVEITVGYGYGAEYPAKAENEDSRHGYAFWVEVRDELKHKPPTQARYLGTAAKAIEPVLGEFVQEGIRVRMEGR
jgi:hypothetical protein